MLTIEFFQFNLLYSGIAIFILGLIIGSFLNVVILRYPEMLKSEWLGECIDFLKEEKIDIKVPKPSRLNLLYPPSHCPDCKKRLRWFHNIPLFSYLFLQGKCAYCHKKISILYPIVELLTGVLTLITFLQFGWQIKVIAALILLWILLVITFIDIHEGLIPDSLSLSLLWLGLFFNLFNLFTPITHAVLGAIVGYIGLFVIANLFRWIRKKEGMGGGDLKLLAALGGWFGLLALPIILMIAVITSLFVSLFIIALAKPFKFDTPIPFAPFLAIGGWIFLMWKEPILELVKYFF